MKLSASVSFGLAMLLAGAADAGEFWVVGSFSSAESAFAERRRLGGLLGVEVSTVDVEQEGRRLTRVLVPYPGAAEARATLQVALRTAGVDRPWRVAFESPAAAVESEAPASMSADVFLVVASLTDVGQSIELERRLDRKFTGVATQSRLIDAELYYRVMVGPVGPADVPALRASLAAEGFGDAWRLAATEVSEKSFENVARLRVSPVPGVSILPRVGDADAPAGSEVLPREPGRAGGGGNGYNLATLDTSRRGNVFGSTRDDARLTTDVAFEYRGFANEAVTGASRHHPSVSLQAEYFNTWNDGNDIFAFVPFYRYDREDDRRSHFDIRELTWVHVGSNWELRTGIRKVFWGVTESQHLVDIINQTDNLENPDGEDKLGQPMVNLSLIRDWGILDLYVLPGFRERDFAGAFGRPRLPLLVETGAAVFESAAEDRRTDFGARWSNYFGELEVGLSHFSGTSREPRFNLTVTTDAVGAPVDAVLVPVYEVIDQTGIDAQYFIGDWAWKLEAISRSGQGDRFSAATFGFEKTFVGVVGRADLGVVAEYLHDSRGGVAPVIGDNDVAVGVRMTRNDAADTTALLVFVQDQDTRELFTTLEGSLRIGSAWKLVVEGAMFSNGQRPAPGIIGVLNELANPDSDLGFFQDEDFLKIELVRYF